MILRQTFSEEVHDYTMDYPVKVIDWSIDTFTRGVDTDGKEKVRVGSWGANRWYDVVVGKTEKQTLANLKRKLAPMMKNRGYDCTFAYIEEE